MLNGVARRGTTSITVIRRTPLGFGTGGRRYPGCAEAATQGCVLERLRRSQISALKTQDSRLKTQDSRLKTQDSRLKTQDSRLKTHPSNTSTSSTNNAPRL